MFWPLWQHYFNAALWLSSVLHTSWERLLPLHSSLLEKALMMHNVYGVKCSRARKRKGFLSWFRTVILQAVDLESISRCTLQHSWLIYRSSVRVKNYYVIFKCLSLSENYKCRIISLFASGVLRLKIKEKHKSSRVVSHKTILKFTQTLVTRCSVSNILSFWIKPQ